MAEFAAFMLGGGLATILWGVFVSRWLDEAMSEIEDLETQLDEARLECPICAEKIW